MSKDTLFENLFESSDVSIWIEDLSSVKKQLNQLASEGIKDLRSYLNTHPKKLKILIDSVHVSQVNPATLKLFGAKNQQDFLNNIEKTFGHGSIDVFIDGLCAMWDNQKIFRSEVHYLSLDGRNIFAILSHPLSNNFESLSSTPVMILDVTELRNKEKALDDYDHRFKTLFEHTDAISVQGYNKNREVIYWNKASETLYGYTASEAIGKQLEDLIIPDNMRKQVIAGAQSWLKDNGSALPSSELTLKKADGSPIHVYSSHVKLFNAQNEAEMYCIDVDLNETKKAVDALKKSEAHLNTLINTIPDLIWLKDTDGKYLHCNARFERFFGAKKADIIGKIDHDFVEKPLADFFREKDIDAMAADQPMINEEQITYADDQHQETLETIRTPLRDIDDHLIGIIGIGRNITSRKQVEQELLEQQALLKEAQTVAKIGHWELDPATLKAKWSDEAFSILGIKPRDNVGPEFLSSLLHPDDRENVIASIESTLLDKSEHHITYRMIRPDGETHWLECQAVKIRDDHGKIIKLRGVIQDITARVMSEEKITHQAHFDTLTDLPNRFLALDRLAQLMEEARRDKKKIAVLFLDLDNFKRINDSMGHEMGDKVLIETAARLNQIIRGGDTVGRLGGDEFIVLLGGLANASDARSVTESLLNRFRDAFRIDEREIVITISVGIAIFPGDGDTSSELLRNADSAMYHAKQQGRNTFSYFTREMNQEALQKLAIEEQMHGALQRKEFEVYYQPKIDISSNRIIGAEALLRWSNPVLGQVTPTEFIPVAEHTGLISSLGQFVLTEALNKTMQWQKQFNDEFCIAVNLSPRQFRDPNLVPDIKQALVESGIKNHHLELEITEGVLLSGYSSIDEALTNLNNLGINIAMDDFGTGYSSLSYLRQYPFDVLKIDRSFVNDISTDSADKELISATVAMAHALKLKVVAEGVETEEQLDFLKQLGCDYAQGYLLGKPMNAESFEKSFFSISDIKK